MNDRELRELLREWKAPATPPSLERNLFASRTEGSWWRLLRGSVRVPVPVCVAMALVLIASVYIAATKGGAQAPLRDVSLTDFRPAAQLEVRVIRGSHANR
ncbi:MAG: hypothetical protein JNN08_28790 [Bryobacterales bacterium]|nr:hypothetical protein [Bryobacterales bacterium]